jgi:signal peptidase I
MIDYGRVAMSDRGDVRASFYLPRPGLPVRPPDLFVPPRQQGVESCLGSQRPPRDRGRQSRSRLVELPQQALYALLLTLLIKTFLMQAFYIPSESMVPTLDPQDRVLIEKVTYRFRAPSRGEIIVFRRPNVTTVAWDWSMLGAVRRVLAGFGVVRSKGEVDYIKRIIGLPGDTVEVHDGVVLVNGEPLFEPYAEPETRDSPLVTVPPNRYFMMGDNRMNSLDSRFGLGLVPRDRIVGRAFVILWPPRSATLVGKPEYPGIGESGD